MLEIDRLTKRFGGVTAVSELSFNMPTGKVTALIGPNGAGKSTAFNLVSGALKPDFGTVRLDHEDVTRWAPYRLQRAGLCRSFQITNLMFDLSVHENVRLAAQARRSHRWSLRRLESVREPALEADTLLEAFELEAHRDAPARTLSHGDQRRLEIAVCMAGQPRLLLLDEPTQGMSAVETDQTEALIGRLARQGVTILLVEHDIELVMAVSDRVIVMQQGVKIAEGTPGEIRSDRRVREAYLGEADSGGGGGA